MSNEDLYEANSSDSAIRYKTAIIDASIWQSRFTAMGTTILATVRDRTIANIPPYVITLAAGIPNLRSFNRIGSSTTSLPLVCPIQSLVGFSILGIRSRSRCSRMKIT